MDEELKTMGESLREMLAIMFDVDEARIDVRVSGQPEGAGARLLWSIDLDGKTPPDEWCEVIETTMRTLFDIANTIRPNSVTNITTGKSEDHGAPHEP